MLNFVCVNIMFLSNRLARETFFTLQFYREHLNLHVPLFSMVRLNEKKITGSTTVNGKRFSLLFWAGVEYAVWLHLGIAKSGKFSEMIDVLRLARKC